MSRNSIKRNTISTLLGAVSLIGLNYGCKAGGKFTGGSAGSNIKSSSGAMQSEADQPLNFNLAEYVRNNDRLSGLQRFVAGGDAYLGIGSKDRFQILTNMNAETKAPMGGAPSFNSDVWLDGFVFNRQLAGDGRGQLVELVFDATPAPVTLQGAVRFLGQEKFHGNISGVWDRTFTRSLSQEATVYPVPLLGVSFGGNIGGEFGVRAQLIYQGDETLAVSLGPKIAVSAGIDGKITALSFASAEADGTVTLLDTSFAHVASLGYHPDLGLLHGNLSIEDRKIKSIIGSVSVKAALDPSLGGKLPEGVATNLWQTVNSWFGISRKWQWEHIVWKPESVKEYELPSFSKFMHRFVRLPASRAECRNHLDKVNREFKKASDQIDDHVRSLTQGEGKDENEPASDLVRAEVTTKSNMAIMSADLENICHNLEFGH